MNRTAGDEGDEVQEVCSIHTIGTDQSKRKGKATTSSASSTNSFDVESLAKLMVNEFNNDVSFEEELIHQRLQKTLTHVLELSSCIYLDDRAWEVLNFDSAEMRL
uniref:Uncharacterized protein n=1 Tax=Tanacetum cinerariifolium TaxID=118510 RepID=A0A699JCN7_TANCI|nr:hypothetical protein [Tanacetum cinerariifolium]